jgi:hypothetical protein
MNFKQKQNYKKTITYTSFFTLKTYSILLFVWYHPSHPAFGIFNVAFVSWD